MDDRPVPMWIEHEGKRKFVTVWKEEEISGWEYRGMLGRGEIMADPEDSDLESEFVVEGCNWKEGMKRRITRLGKKDIQVLTVGRCWEYRRMMDRGEIMEGPEESDSEYVFVLEGPNWKEGMKRHIKIPGKKDIKVRESKKRAAEPSSAADPTKRAKVPK